MWNLLACRACLVRGVRLESYERHNLHRAYEAVTGIKLNSSSELPRYLCYECAALLRKCWHFRRRCRRTEAILQNILRLEGTTTDDDLDKLDRVACHVASPLSVVALEPTVIDIEEDSKCVDDLRDIKTIDEELDKLVREACQVSPGPSVVDTGENWNSIDDSHFVEEDEGVGEDKKEIELTPLVAESDACEREETMKKKTTAKKTVRQRKIRTKKERTTKTKTNEGKTKKSGRNKLYPLSYYEEFATVTVLTPEQQVQELEKKKNSENYRVAPYKCTMCYKIFISETTYKTHALLHDPVSGDIECDICRRRFTSRRKQRNHKANVHERLITCKKCDYVVANPTAARLHELWHRGTSYKCPHCEHSFKIFTTYLSHIRIKHPSQFSCELCGNSFVSEKGVQQHKSLAHSCEKEVTISGPHCPSCETTFATEEAFERHLVVSAKHIGETSNACNGCGEIFVTVEELRRHNRTQSCGNVTNEQCHVKMGYPYIRRSDSDKNGTRISKERADFMCETCGKIFKKKVLFDYHQRRCTKKKSHECATCKKKFYDAWLLSMHTRMRCGKLYECDICNKKFNVKGNLRRHIDTHSSLKLHKCRYCDKRFKSVAESKSHANYVHLKKPWPRRNRTKKNEQS